MSGISNEEVVRKAVITADLLAAAGKLNPAQSDKFIDYVLDETVLRDSARVVRFTNESLEIDKIGIGTRAALPKAEASDPGLRRTISTSKVTLTPKEIMVPFEIGDTFREVSIEGADVEDTIVRLMATQSGNDVEELSINGDELGHSVAEATYKGAGSTTDHIKDAFLALVDGWLTLADAGNVYDAAGANVGLPVFNGMLRQMPTKFRRNLSNLRWYLSPNLWQLYIEKLTTRATPLGDIVAGGGMHKPLGIEPVQLPLMDFLPPTVKHVVLTGTTVASLGYAPVSSVVVTPSTLGTVPTTPYIETTDYVVDYTAGTIARSGGASAILTGATVKVTFAANPQILLTHKSNFIVGIGRDVRIEKDRDIFKGVNQYAITLKTDVEYEEDSAIVKGINIGSTV